MAATQRPGSVGGLSGHSGVPAWKSVPSWFVIPTADNVIPPAVQRFMAKRAGGKVKEVPGASHVVTMIMAVLLVHADLVDPLTLTR